MSKHVTNMTIFDVDHYSPEDRQRIIESYPAHERDARAKGIPILGSGRVFPIEEEALKVKSLAIPSHWARLISIDFGWDHPFAATALAWDRDADVVYVTACYRQRESTPAIHADVIRGWGTWIPVAWPHDGYQHDKGSGQQLSAIYKSKGLNMLPEKAEHAEGGYGVEAGITEMLERMQTGRLKVFDHLSDWFEEFRLYHREKGQIVKEHDDLMSATRIGIMMLREAKTKPTAVKLDYSNIGRGLA
jgi:hypothetical protein